MLAALAGGRTIP